MGADLPAGGGDAGYMSFGSSTLWNVGLANDAKLGGAIARGLVGPAMRCPGG